MEIKADVWNEDCIANLTARLQPGSVSLTTTSIPFEEIFSYSGKMEDLGNNGSTVDIKTGRFALNLRFFVEQLYQVQAPGTNACLHIQQLLAHACQHGYMGRRDFRGAVIDVFRAGGWNFAGEVSIPKDPQQLAQRLKLHSLQFKTGHSRSSTKWAMAPNDYVLIFQKPGEVEHPVRPLVYHKSKKPQRREEFYEQLGHKDINAYTAYLQDWARKEDAINPTGWLSANDWILWARGTWDIDQFDVLDGARSSKQTEGLKEEAEEKHVCPLQLSLIERLVMLYSNPAILQPDVLVLDPFAGIGSVPHVAVQLGRHTAGFELKESYHRAALNNIQRARQGVKEANKQNDLFASLEDKCA